MSLDLLVKAGLVLAVRAYDLEIILTNGSSYCKVGYTGRNEVVFKKTKVRSLFYANVCGALPVAPGARNIVQPQPLPHQRSGQRWGEASVGRRSTGCETRVKPSPLSAHSIPPC